MIFREAKNGSKRSCHLSPMMGKGAVIQYRNSSSLFSVCLVKTYCVFLNAAYCKQEWIFKRKNASFSSATQNKLLGKYRHNAECLTLTRKTGLLDMTVDFRKAHLNKLIQMPARTLQEYKLT